MVIEFWVLIPLAAIVMWGAQGIARAVFAGRRAQADRVRGPDDETRRELEDLRMRVAELEERQDFTDRVLTRGRGGDPESGAMN